MKNTKLVLIVGILLLTSIAGLLAGCGGDKKPASPASSPASQASAPAKPAAASEETLASIMMKAKQAPGYSCDIVMTAPGFSSTSKMWIAKDKMKMENTFEGKKMITIVDGDTTYMYDPGSQTAMKFTSKDMPGEMGNKIENPSDYDKNMVKDSLKFIENVVYEGVKCRVVMYTEKEEGTTAKMWLREDYGLPMKQEITSKKGEKMTIEYKNMKIGAPSADNFKLPAGVKIQDVGAMMQNQQKGGK